MEERRTESRLWCADMLEARWTDAAGAQQRATALLEDISKRGACLQLEMPLAPETAITIDHPKLHLEGTVRYCVYREIGYFVGIEFGDGHQWSRSRFRPEHLLDLKQMVLRRARRGVRRRG